jgi:hypothetical protein
MVGLTGLGCHLPRSLVLLPCSLVLAFHLSQLLNGRCFGSVAPGNRNRSRIPKFTNLETETENRKTEISVRFGAVRFGSVCVCSLRSVPVRNYQVQPAGAGAFTGQTCVCSCRLEPAPSLCLVFGTAVSSRSYLVGRVQHLCFQAPISARPGTRALTAPRAGVEQFTLIEFSAAVAFC